MAEGKGASHAAIRRKRFPGRANSVSGVKNKEGCMCKGLSSRGR